jgi:protein-disulfide isomerase
MDKPENKPANTSPAPIRLPAARSDEPGSGDVIVINQTTVYYFVIAVLFFIAGFAVAWITFSTTIDSKFASVRDQVITAASSAAGESVATAMAGIGAGGSAVAVQPTSTPVPRQNVSVGQGASWGPANAKVTIVEFSDFQCPFCEMFYSDTYQLIRKQYGDKVRFVYRQFPISSLHPYALGAALASECALEQGKFWEYHDALFSNQSNLTKEALLKYADQAKVPDTKQFASCLDSQKYLSKIQADLQEGAGYSVQGTPTFFINGNILVGAQPFANFAAAIDSELRQAGG